MVKLEVDSGDVGCLLANVYSLLFAVNCLL